MVEFGYFLSLLCTTTIYTFIGILSVKVYDYYGIDCLWLEQLKKSQCEGDIFDSSNPLIRFIEKWIKKNKKFLGLLLSFKNPGLMVIYYRDGFYQYNGFTGKNIKLIFLVNIVLINLYWNSIIYTGFSLWEFLTK